jgi:hypothetical protein
MRSQALRKGGVQIELVFRRSSFLALWLRRQANGDGGCACYALRWLLPSSSYPLLCLPLSCQLRYNWICMIMGAAHGMPPRAGAGAGLGIEDALILTSCLGLAESERDIMGASKIYDAVQRLGTQNRPELFAFPPAKQFTVALWEVLEYNPMHTRRIYQMLNAGRLGGYHKIIEIRPIITRMHRRYAREIIQKKQNKHKIKIPTCKIFLSRHHSHPSHVPPQYIFHISSTRKTARESKSNAATMPPNRQSTH